MPPPKTLKPLSISLTGSSGRSCALLAKSIKQHSREFLLAALYLDPEKAAEVEALIEDLGLMFMGAEKVEEADEEKPDDTSSPN